MLRNTKKIAMTQTFSQVLESRDLKAIQSLPKSDLHNHSLTGSRRNAIAQQLGRAIPPPPHRFQSIDEMTAYSVATLGELLHTIGGFEFLHRAAFQQARDDGVCVLEMSVHSGFVGLFPNRQDGFVETLKAVHQKIAPGIEFYPEIGLARESDTAVSCMCAEWLIDTGYFRSIDLYGDELTRPASAFRDLYQKAKRKGLRLKAHVGEFGSAESIREAVEVLELDEIQHGITAARSPEVMKWLRENEIQLNVCPTSNVVLSRVESLAVHPIRTLFDNGVRVTINSDDILVFDKSVSEEYLSLFQAGTFSAEELDEIREQGLASRGF